MNVLDIIRASKKTLFTFELMPPLKGNSFDEIAQVIERLLPYHPAYINITNHRAERTQVTYPDGRSETCVVKKRAGTAAIAAAIKYRYNVEVVPHLVCSGYTSSEIEDMLLDLGFLGICNILALRGDLSEDEKQNGLHDERHAIDVLHQAMRMNEGIFLDESIQNAALPVQFCAGVAGYPEKHAEAPDFAADLRRLKEKIDNGASYIVTQMFFDNQKYFRFVEECRKTGIRAPVIPGLKPLAAAKHIDTLPRTFHISIPDALREQVQRCANPHEVRLAGEKWCIAQCRELQAAGVPVLHFYTMSKAINVEKVVRTIFGQK